VKGKLFLAGILAMALVFAMMAAGCDNGSTGNGGGVAFIGETLNLSGQVWTLNLDGDENDTMYKRFTGNRTGIHALSYQGGGYINIGGSGSITNGQLNFSIGTPLELASIQDEFEWMTEDFSNVTISPSNARIAELAISGGGWLDKQFFDFIDSNIYYQEAVLYIYFDRNVTITGSGKTTTHECDCEELRGHCNCAEWGERCDCSDTYITRNINLSFKTGWNVITKTHTHEVNNNTETLTFSAGDSSRARWFLDEYNSYSMNIQGFSGNMENTRINNTRPLFKGKR